MAAKISGLIVAILFVGLFTVIYFSAAAEFSTSYARTDYDPSSLKVYNQMNETKKLINTMWTNNTGQQRSGIDVIGGFFTGAYQTMMITKSSVDTFSVMSDQAVSQNSGLLGSNAEPIKIFIMSVMILLMVGTFLYVVFKVDW